MPFVLDASVAISWCFPDEFTSASREALQLLHASYAVVPGLWLAEVRNVLLLAERRGRIRAEDTEAFLVKVGRLDIRVHPELGLPGSSSDRVLDMARRWRLTAYDATYLDLAKHENLPLATFDRELLKAAPLEGVALLPHPA